MAELKIQVVLDPISVANIEKTLKGMEANFPKIELKIEAEGLQGVEKSVIGLSKKWIEYQIEVEKTKRAHEKAIPSIERSRAEYEKTRQQVAKAVQENQKYQAAVEKTAQAEEKTKQAFEKTRQAEEKTTQEGLKLAQQHEKTARAADNNTKSHNQFWQTLTRTFSMAQIATTAFTTAVSKVRSAFSEALTTMKEVDTAVSHYRQVTGASIEEGNQLASQAYEIASKYGQAASSYVEAVANYARAGYAEQADDLAELSMKTQIAGQTTAEIADQFLLTMDAAYKYEGSVEKLSAVLDGAAKIDSTYATTVEKIAAGLGLVAPLAEQVHVSEAELTAAIGTITAATQRSGAEAARALRSLFLNIIADTTTEIEDGVTATEESVASVQYVLEKYAKSAVDAARATGQVVDPMEAIGALAQSMEDGLLTESQLMDLLSGIGGKLRISQLVALISHWDMYKDMMEDYGNAAGDADKKVSVALDSWEYKINVLKNTFAEFVAKTINSEFVKGFIDGLTKVISMVGNLGNALAILGGIVGAFKLSQWSKKLSDWSSKMAEAGNVTKAAFGNFASGATSALAGVTALMTAAYTVYSYISKMKEEEIKARQQAAEDANQAADTAKIAAEDMLTLYATYQEAQSAYKEGTGSVEAYDTATRQLAEALGIEEGALVSVRREIQNKSDAEIQAMLKEAEVQANLALNTTKNSAQGALKDLNTRYYGADIPNAVLSGIQNIYGIGDYADKTGEAAMKRMLSVYHSYEKELEDIVKDTNGLSTATKQQTERYEQLQAWIKLLPPELLEYEKASQKANDVAKMAADYASGAWKEYADTLDGAADSSDGMAGSADGLAGSLDGVEESVSSATAAIEKFKESTKVNLDDNFKGFAEIWDKAMQDIEKGFENSATVQAAAKALFGDEFVEEAKKQGISAAELIQNDFLKTVYTFDGKFTGGEDSGSLLAYYLYEGDLGKYRDEAGNIIDVNGDVVASFEMVGDELSMSVKDIEGLAGVMGEITGVKMDTSWWAAFLEATTQYGPDSAETVWAMAEAMGVLHGYGDTRFIDENEFREAAKAIGFTDQYVDMLLDSIRDLNEASEEMAKDDYDIDYHANTEEAQQKVEELTEATQSYENGSPYTATVTLSDQVSNKVWEIKSSLNNLASTYTASVAVATPYATGTKNASGGMALVNENGPELIKDGGLARIAGNGKPTLTWLNQGATVYNANETRKILAGADLSSLYDGIGAYATGIKRWTPSGSGGTGGGDTGSTGSTGSTASTTSYTASSDAGSVGGTIAAEAAAAEDYLETLKNIVALRKSELDVTKANNESFENIAARQQAYTNALRDQVNYMIDQGASWTDINNLKVTMLGSEEALAKLYEEQAEAAKKAEEEAKKEAEEKAEAAREEKRNHIDDLATTVEWRKSEAELSEARNESTETQIKKQQDVITALKAQKEYLKEIQEGEEDWIELNRLSQEIIEENNRLLELQQKEEKEAQEKKEEQQQKNLQDLSDAVTLRKSELNILDSSGADVDKLVAKQREIQKALKAQIAYMQQIGADQAEINNLIAEVYDIDNSINQLYEQRDAELQKKQEEAEQAKADKIQEQLDKLADIVSLKQSELKLIQAQNGSVRDQILKQREIQTALNNQIKYMKKIGAEQEEINKLLTDWYDISEDIAKLENGLLTDLQKAIKNEISEINEERDAEIQKIKDKIAKLKEERGVQSDQADLEAKMLAVEEARAKLQNAMAEQTVRIYNAATGQWERVANATNVKAAREALETAQQNLADYKDKQAFDALISALEAQQQDITDKYAQTTDKWQAIIDKLEDPVITIAEALKNISDNATKNMKGDINSLNKLLKPLGYSISTANLYDSGGVLAGMGGIKATAQDEMVLPPDLTQRMLSPLATSSFASRMNELKYLYGMTANGNMAGSTGNSIGAQYNGGQYHFGDIIMSAEQAKQTTVYDLVNMSRGLRAFSSSL